jgi:hypothetical protein
MDCLMINPQSQIINLKMIAVKALIAVSVLLPFAVRGQQSQTWTFGFRLGADC